MFGRAGGDVAGFTAAVAAAMWCFLVVDEESFITMCKPF
jgi:hypothetical protein